MDQTTYRAADQSSSATFAPDDASHPPQPNGREQASGPEPTKQQAKQAAESVQQQATEMTEAAKQKAFEAAEHAKQSGAQYARQKKARIAEEIGIFSGAIRKASSKLHEEQHDSIASYVDVAAEQLDHYRQSLESKDIGELIDDVQDFTRRRPEIVYGGMFIAGLAAMRFLKASKPTRSRDFHRDLSQDRNRPAAAFGHDPQLVATSPPQPGYPKQNTPDEDGGHSS